MNEPLPKTDRKYVLLEAGDYYVAIPLDVFIEMDGEIPILRKVADGMQFVHEPTVFKMLTQEHMDALREKG